MIDDQWLRVLLGTKRGLVFSTLRAETKVVGPKFEYHVKIFLLSIAYRGSAIRSLLSRTFTMILQQYYNHCVVSLKSRVWVSKSTRIASIKGNRAAGYHDLRVGADSLLQHVEHGIFKSCIFPAFYHMQNLCINIIVILDIFSQEISAKWSSGGVLNSAKIVLDRAQLFLLLSFLSGNEIPRAYQVMGPSSLLEYGEVTGLE